MLESFKLILIDFFEIGVLTEGVLIEIYDIFKMVKIIIFTLKLVHLI